jgi:chromosome segregation ATPase
MALKLAALTDRCAALTRSNLHLTQTVELLHRDLQDHADALPDDALNDFIDTLQRETATLRQQLDLYREKQQAQARLKDEEMGRLREVVEELTQDKLFLEQERTALIDANEEIARTNQNLILEIENLENELMENRSEAQSSRSYRYNSRRDTGFEGEVQAELEHLIEKLVAELEFERGQKRRLSEEIKRMQANIMELEREIATKTNKIYSLEMSYLKSNRLSPRNDRPEKAQDRTLKYSKSNAQLPSQERNSRSDRSAPKSFTLMYRWDDVGNC